MRVPEDTLKVLKDPEELPAYRRLIGGGHYYRIIGADRFEELQRIGQRWIFHRVNAKAYPEQVRVLEMVDLAGPYEVLEQGEWERVLRLAGTSG